MSLKKKCKFPMFDETNSILEFSKYCLFRLKMGNMNEKNIRHDDLMESKRVNMQILHNSIWMNIWNILSTVDIPFSSIFV